MHKHEWGGKHQDQHPQRITVKASYPERPMSARACMFNQISTGIGAEIACWGNHCHIIAAWASLPEQTQANHFIICRAIQVKAQSHVGLWNHLSALIQAQVQSRSQVLGPLNRTTRHPFVLFLSIFSKKWKKWCDRQSQSHTAILKPTNFVYLAAWKPDLYGDQSVSIRIEEIKNHALHTSVSCAAKVPRVPPDCKALLQHMASLWCGNAEASAPLPESSSAAAKNLVYPMPGKGAAIECREVFWNKNSYHFHISKSWCTISMATR